MFLIALARSHSSSRECRRQDQGRVLRLPDTSRARPLQQEFKKPGSRIGIVAIGICVLVSPKMKMLFSDMGVLSDKVC